MKINIVCVGKLREKYWEDAAREYTKRLGRFASITICELSEELCGDDPSEAEVEKVIEKQPPHSGEV